MVIKEVSPRETKAALDSDPDAVYLDVRTEQEFAHGHPAGALNIPVMFLDTTTGGKVNDEFLKVVEGILARNRAIFCGCKSGGRSLMAAEMLSQAGYESVASVLGGFSGAVDRNGLVVAPGWVDCGLPVSHEVSEANSYAALRKKAGL